MTEPRRVFKKIGRYFDLNSNLRAGVVRGLGSESTYEPKTHTLPQWLSLFLGVLIQPYFDGYKQTHQWVWNGFWANSLFAIIASFLIFPAVYRRAFDQRSTVWVQLAPIFASGIGWQSLLGAALSATRH